MTPEIEALCARLEQGIPFQPTAIDPTAPNATAFAEPDWKATVTLMLEAAAKLREMAGALEQARDQFAFYAREHRAAGKDEKAATNQRFADMLAAALAGGSHG